MNMTKILTHGGGKERQASDLACAVQWPRNANSQAFLPLPKWRAGRNVTAICRSVLKLVHTKESINARPPWASAIGPSNCIAKCSLGVKALGACVRGFRRVASGIFLPHEGHEEHEVKRKEFSSRTFVLFMLFMI
jgi:hypothetical protein